ncbi:hypothetical protein [Brevibacillus choshinensis]|uniref:hypothetical protein n=1 Tax=Brevibacillus choshinensis TaxID=54911 RepID=UPI002E23FE09|nr:hypothetical protein [Brevibacillus choshinensis]
MWASKWIGIVGSMIWGFGMSGTGLAVPTPEASQIAPAPAVYEELKIARQDVTGDGRPDLITLLGKRFASDSPYYEQLKLMVQDPVAKKVSFFQTTYGGYEPELSFCDFIGNKTNQILVQAPTGGSAGTSDFYLFSDKDNNPAVLPVPQPLTITGSYQDGYKVSLTIKETNQTTVLDLSDRKDIYEENGVYKNGKLVQQTEVMPNTYSVLTPVKVRDGICALKGEQRVSGIANADTIAYVESLWKWENNGWKLQSARVKKAER